MALDRLKIGARRANLRVTEKKAKKAIPFLVWGSRFWFGDHTIPFLVWGVPYSVWEFF
jgi:hypothetical protein